MEFHPWRHAALFGLGYLAACWLFFLWVPAYRGDGAIVWVVIPMLAASALLPAYASIKRRATAGQLVVLWLGSVLMCIPAWALGMGWVLSTMGAEHHSGIDPWAAIGDALSREPEAILVFGMLLVVGLISHLILLLMIYTVLIASWTRLLRPKTADPDPARDPGEKAS